MVIRCERCSTLYELDESLLAPTGSEVQCTKCQHVFTAFPTTPAGRTLVGVPAQPAAPAAGAPAAGAVSPASSAPSAGTAPSSRATSPAPAAAAPAPAKPEGAGAPRPVRTTAPAVYRPQASAGSAGAALPRGPVLKRDTVGTFEARLRWSSRVRWLVPLAAAAVVVLAGAVWALLARRGDAGAERTRAAAMDLVARDDSASVEEAVGRLGAVVNKRPKLRAAAADRALALVVRAATTAEEAEALTARLADLRDARERARREQPPGWQEAERAATAEATRIEPELRAREDKTRALSSGARDQLTILEAEGGDTREVLRALALLHAFTGERDRLRRDLRIAQDGGIRDPWLDLASGWADARDPERASRERALVRLGALAAARPELLRARYLLARAQLSLGRKTEALATAEGVLAANPAHEGARRIRDELTARAATQAPAPGVAAPAAAPAQAHPGPETPPPRRRKPVAQPGTELSAHAPAAVAAPATAAATAPATPPGPAPASAPPQLPPPATPAPATPAPVPAAVPASAPPAPAAAPAVVPAAAPATPSAPPRPRKRDASAPAGTDAG